MAETETKTHDAEKKHEPITREAAEKMIASALQKHGAKEKDVRVLGDKDTILVTASVPVDQKANPPAETRRITMPAAAEGLTRQAVEATIAAAGLK